jgi:hypothetical protein
MLSWLPDQVRPATLLGGRSEFPAHAGLTDALSRLIEWLGDDERSALENVLPVVEQLAGDLTGQRR